MNNRIWIPVLIIPLVIALIVGLFFIFRTEDNVEPKDPDTTDNGTVVDPEDIEGLHARAARGIHAPPGASCPLLRLGRHAV